MRSVLSRLSLSLCLSVHCPESPDNDQPTMSAATTGLFWAATALTRNTANLEPHGHLMDGGVYLILQIGRVKVKRCHTLGAGAHAHGWLACFSRQKNHCALCPVLLQPRYSRHVDQVLSVLYVCRPGTENYDTVSQCCTRYIRPAPSPSCLLCVLGWVI